LSEITALRAFEAGALDYLLMNYVAIGVSTRSEAWTKTVRVLRSEHGLVKLNGIIYRIPERVFLRATVDLFRSLCKEKGIETPLPAKLPMIIEGTLFDMSGSSN